MPLINTLGLKGNESEDMGMWKYLMLCKRGTSSCLFSICSQMFKALYKVPSHCWQYFWVLNVKAICEWWNDPVKRNFQHTGPQNISISATSPFLIEGQNISHTLLLSPISHSGILGLMCLGMDYVNSRKGYLEANVLSHGPLPTAQPCHPSRVRCVLIPAAISG